MSSKTQKRANFTELFGGEPEGAEILIYILFEESNFYVSMTSQSTRHINK